MNCGVTGLMQSVPPEDVQNYLPMVTAVQKLLSPAEMGELFKVIALGREIDPPLLGFATGDLSRLL